jgi:hypothetical protein
MKDNDEFYIDREKERHMLTMNPCGYLRKIPVYAEEKNEKKPTNI